MLSSHLTQSDRRDSSSLHEWCQWIQKRGNKSLYKNLRLKKAGSPTWIEGNFCKRECIKFVPSTRDNARCCCGQLWQCHRDGSPATLRGPGDPELHWSPSRHTHLLPTDAYGTIEFQGGPVPTKAQYIRLSHDTRPDLIIDLLCREWNLDLPKLLITVQGGKTNFELQPKLKKVIRKGLWKAAKTTGAWVFTAGTNTGVTRHVGEALVSESSVRIRGGGRVVSVGIAAWGIVERRQDLIGRNRDVPYHPITAPRSKFAALNSHHTYFLLVDNGTSGKYGAELILRRKLENYISKQRIQTRGGLATPVVCVVIEGGPHTIRQVLEYVTDSPPVPVIVCDGTGRAADILAFVYKCVEDGRLSAQNTGVFDHVRGVIIATLEREFDLRTEQAEKLFSELLQCVHKKELITVFRLKEGSELDQSILSALLHSHCLSDPEKLSLALTWNRVDIARTHVFNEDVEWPQGSLELAMMDALVHDRIEFVKLLLEQGVTMNKFLTIQRLEDLYNAKQGPSNTLRYIIRDVKKNVPRDYRYSLLDIGLVINKLMGGAFRSTYTRRKFRNMYNSIMKTNSPSKRHGGSIYKPVQPQHTLYQGAAIPQHLHAGGGQLIGNNLLLGVSRNRSFSPKASAVTSPNDREQHSLFVDPKANGEAGCVASPAHFDYPFSELMMWSVLTKRQGLALLMWQHGEEALAKSLVAAKLYKALASEAADDDLETEVYEELRSYAKEFETRAVELLTFCYQQDDDRAHQLLTYELRNWSKQTCLSLAVAVNHRSFIAQPCCQILLADLWLGGLRTRKNTNIKVLLGLLFPPLITCLSFRSREELRTMPQTREERWDVTWGEPGGANHTTGDSESASDSDEDHHHHHHKEHHKDNRNPASGGPDVPEQEATRTSRAPSPLLYTTTTFKVPLVGTNANNSAPGSAPPASGRATSGTLTSLFPPLAPITLIPRHGQPPPPSAVFPFLPPDTEPASVFGGSVAENNGLTNCYGRGGGAGSDSDRMGEKDQPGILSDREYECRGSGRVSAGALAARRRSMVSSQCRRDAVVVQSSTLLTDQSSFLDHKKAKELSAKVKFYEFYNAPITKFWAHSFAYMVFLCMFTYVVLVKLPDFPHWTEWYSIAYITALMLEKVRQIMAKEPHKLKQKLEVWSDNRWNISDSVCGIMFLIALALRLQPDPLKSAGRVMYCTNIMYWYLKILEILSSHKYLGPLVMMMGKMIKNMAYFVVLLLVVLMAFGVCRQSILNPDEEPRWRLARHIFYQPYFMLYGEVFADDIDPDCGGPGEIPCHPGRWITPTAMSIYLLVANILLINLLIAVFNNIFISINAMSQQVWKFQRFQVVMEFEERPVFPPPLILFSHAHRTVKYLRRWWQGKPPLHDKGLKLFLDSDSLQRVHDFEEECVYGYIREKNEKEQMTTEERVRVMADRSEVTVQRLEDINTKFVATLTALNGTEFRIKRLEEELSHTRESYSVVHRFMVNYMDRHRSGSTSPRSGYNSRSVSPRTRSRPSSRAGSPGSYHSRSTLREMLEETQMNMLKTRYLSVTEEDESDDADESESSEEETQVTSKFEEIVRKRTNAKHAAETEDQVGAAEEKTEDKIPEGKPKVIPSRLLFDKKSRNSMDTGDEGDSEKDATGRRKSHAAVRHGTDKYKETTSEGEKMSRRVRDEGRRHHSGSSSLARASKDRGLSGTQNKSNIRRSSRSSRKNSTEDQIFSPSRVSFMGFESNRYAAEDSDTDAVVHVEGRRHGSGGDRHHAVQRSVSTPGEPSAARRESPSRYERSHSSTSSRPRIRVIPPSSPPPPIIKINAEYTSLADELEDVVMARLSPPSTPHVRFGRVRHYTEGLGVSLRGFHNPLRDAEEVDFLIMEGLIQKRLYRDSENLAVSLEELCSLHTDTSDREISLVIQSQLQQSDAGFTIEKSPTMHEMGTGYDPDFMDITSPSGPDLIPSNRNRKLGYLGGLNKRHSIGMVDTSKLTQSRPSHTAIDVGSQPSDPSVSYDASPPSMATSTPQNTAQGIQECPHPPPVRLASPEQTSINSPNSPQLTRAVPQNLTLSSCGLGLLPPRRMLASPVHSLLIVDQSVVPLTLATSDPQGSLLPPSQPLASPLMHHMHVSSQPEHLPMQQQQLFRKCDASMLSTSSSHIQRPSSPAGGLSVVEGGRALPYSLANPSLPSFLYPTTISTTTTLLQVKSGGRSPTTAGLFTVPPSQGPPEPLTSVHELRTSLSPPPGGRSPTYSSSGVGAASSLFQGHGAYHAPSQSRGLEVSDSVPAARGSFEAYSTAAIPKMQLPSLSRDLPTKVDAFNGETSSIAELCSKSAAAGGKEGVSTATTLSTTASAGVGSPDKDLDSSDLVAERRKKGSCKNLTETEC